VYQFFSSGATLKLSIAALFYAGAAYAFFLTDHSLDFLFLVYAVQNAFHFCLCTPILHFSVLSGFVCQVLVY
jgi:hypothetical protein